jgi:hypothetical protein
MAPLLPTDRHYKQGRSQADKNQHPNAPKPSRRTYGFRDTDRAECLHLERHHVEQYEGNRQGGKPPGLYLV